MLLKFAYQDFLNDRRFKNTTKTNIKNYEMLLVSSLIIALKDK
jgi:integrase/recombinase XerD